jgi:hypothetical protein
LRSSVEERAMTTPPATPNRKIKKSPRSDDHVYACRPHGPQIHHQASVSPITNHANPWVLGLRLIASAT